MVKITYEDGEDKISIERADVVTGDDMAKLFYSLMLGLGYSENVTNNFIKCEWNNWGEDSDGN